MKRIICLLSFLCFILTGFAQNEDYSQYEVKYQPDNRYFVEFGVGAFIPTDDSNTFTGIDLEVGSYLNDYLTVGLNFKYSSESEWDDELNFLGPKVRYRVKYSPRNILDFDIFTGLGYGWYRFHDYYDDGYYSYKMVETMNYIVPTVGVAAYINVSKNVAIGFEPGFMWYISTDLEKSRSVGVWNIEGKCKLSF